MPDSSVDIGDLVRRGRLARRSGGREASLPFFEAAISAAPTQVTALLECARDYEELGRLDEAAAVYRRILAVSPAHGDALLRLGRILRRGGGSAASVALFEGAVAADPGARAAAFELATDYRNLGRLAEAERVYGGIVAAEPANLAARLGLGHVVRRLHGEAAALALFEAAVACQPDHAGARLQLARSLRRLARFDEAEALYGAIRRDDPRQTAATLALAQLARRRGDRSVALALFEEAAAETGHAGAQLELAMALDDQGEPARAFAILERVLSADPANLDALMRHALIAKRNGDPETALQSLGRVLTARPDHVPALVETAMIERAQGQPAKSEATLRRALTLAPDHLGALRAAAEHALLGDAATEALAIARRAQAAHADNAVPYLLESRALTDLGRVDEALAALDRGEISCGPHPEIVARRIDILRMAGLWSDVRQAAHQAADLARWHFGLWQKRVQIDICLGELAKAGAALAAPHAGSRYEMAYIHWLRALHAEAEWRLDDAAAQYQEALAIKPDSGGMHAALARVSMLRLDLDAASEHLRQSLRSNASATLLRDKSFNLSQSSLGQLLDEFRIDRDACGALTALARRPAAERIGPLRTLVRLKPDLTSAAICLLIALRQAGLLTERADPTPAHRAAARIPRRIIQYWDATDRPDDLERLMQTWRDHHPGWDYRCFDDAAARDFLRGSSPEVLRAYVRAKHPAQKSDIFRLAYLAREGGFYADADDRSLAPLPTIVPAHASLALYQELYGTIGNNFLGAARGDAVIARALALAVEALNRGDSDILWLATGPGLVTRAFAQILAEASGSAEAWLAPIVVFETSTLRRAVGSHGIVRYKDSDQHWQRAMFKGRSKQAAAAAPLLPMPREEFDA